MAHFWKMTEATNLFFFFFLLLFFLYVTGTYFDGLAHRTKILIAKQPRFSSLRVQMSMGPEEWLVRCRLGENKSQTFHDALTQVTRN